MKARAVFVLSFFLVAHSLIAGDSWKKKPPAQWTSEEAVEILTDSPWARQVSVWQVTGERQEQRVAERRDTYQDAPGEAPLSVSSGVTGTVARTVEGVYGVQWSSAAVVREAAAQLRQTAGEALVELHGPPAELPADQIVVSVHVAKPPAAPALPLWANLDDSQLAGRARLATSDKRAVRPIRARRHGVGASEAASFYFPRQADGQPTLGAQTKWAEFSLESRQGDKLKARFKLSEMRVGGQPDY